MLDASKLGRNNTEKEVQILDDEMHSRYEKTRGKDGLCSALVELFNAMVELRLQAEYGDYLACTCTALKEDRMKDLKWKIEKLDWQDILAFADRNNFCHSGIKNMAEKGNFQELGEQILEDLRSLELIFRERPQDQIDMRRVIKIVEREWFRRLWIDETGKQRRVKFILTEKGMKKMYSIAPAASSSS
ncbi:hypothetical protein ACLMJK_008213 [Lecanora helva]